MKMRNKIKWLTFPIIFGTVGIIIGGLVPSFEKTGPNNSGSNIEIKNNLVNNTNLLSTNINELSNYEFNQKISNDILKNFNNNDIKFDNTFNADFKSTYTAQFKWYDAELIVLPENVALNVELTEQDTKKQQVRLKINIIDDDKIEIVNEPIYNFGSTIIKPTDNSIYTNPLIPSAFNPDLVDPLDTTPFKISKTLLPISITEGTQVFNLSNYINFFVKETQPKYLLKPDGTGWEGEGDKYYKLYGQRSDTFGEQKILSNGGLIGWQVGRYDFWPTFGHIEIINEIIDDNGNVTDQVDPFFEQVFYHFKKNEAINWINFGFDSINANDLQKLKLGPKNDGTLPWDASYITNEEKSKSFPTFINWKSNVSTLLECEKINDLIVLCDKWKSLLSPSNPANTIIDNFVNGCINKYYFNSYDELNDIYQKYYVQITNDIYGSNATLIQQFKNDVNKLIEQNSSAPYIEKLNSLFNELNTYKIISLSGSFQNKIALIKNNASAAMNKYKGYELTFNNENEDWIGLKLLAQLFQGAICSNDIVCDIVTYPAERPNEKFETKDVQIYSSSTNQLNNSFITNTIQASSDFDVGGEIFKIEFKNFRIKNRVKNVFLNIDSTTSDSNLFTNLNNLTKSSIDFYWNPSALNFSNFNYENWMFNKVNGVNVVDAVGISMNKYLSEIINIENDSNKEAWEFIDEDIKQDIIDLLNGNYYSKNENNLEQKVAKPVWLVAENEPTDKNLAFNGKTIYTVSKNDIDYMFANNYFSKDDWNDALKVFGIITDETENKYPLIKPNQNNGEFYIITSITNFHKSTNYINLKTNLLNTRQAPIVLINKNGTKENQNGFFLVKLKTVHDQDINFDVANQRTYNISNAIDPNGVITIADSLNTFFNVLNDKDENGNYKYWMLKQSEVVNSSFFNSEGWKNNDISINYLRLWKDIFSDNSNIIPDEAIRKNAINYFRKNIDSKIYDFLKTKYGNDSQVVEQFEYYEKNLEYYNAFYDGITTETLINGIPYFFYDVYWNNMNNYKEYTLIKIQLTKPEISESEKQELNKKLENNAFYKFLTQNEINPTKQFTNQEIENMFFNGLKTQEGIFSDKYTNDSIDNDTYDPLKAKLKEQFNQFKRNWNLGSANGGVIQIEQKTYTFDEWKQYVHNELEKLNMYNVYQKEYKEIFIENYNYYIKDLVNYVSFNVGNEVNNNLVFTTIEEMINDPLVGFLFEQFGVDVNKCFIKKPYEVNSSVVENAFVYELNPEANFPFEISQKNINGVSYYILGVNGANLKVELDIKTLYKLAQLKSNDADKKAKVYENNSTLASTTEQSFSNFDKLQKEISKTEAEQVDYWSKLNIGSIVLVSVLPITVIVILLISFWLVKSKKRKKEF